MNNFTTIYRILRYLEKAMDYDEVDMERISAATLGISEQRRSAILKILADDGYIDGIDVKKSITSETLVSIASPCITLKGLEYLQENSLMAKAANLAKGIAEII